MRLLTILFLPLLIFGGAHNDRAGDLDMLYSCCRRVTPIPNVTTLCDFTDHTLCNVIMYGDSITELSERDYATNTPVPNPSITPPHMEVESYAKRVWDALGNQATYQRYDSGIFTEIGTWQTSAFVAAAEPADWNDKTQRPYRTRYNTSANAGVSWSAGACDTFSFIYRRSAAGAAGVIELLNGATGQVWNGSAWVNANGYVVPFSNFSTQVNNRLHFRVADPGDIIIRDTGSGRIQYWGLERYTTPPTRVLNQARSGLNIDQMYSFFNDDMKHEPDYVIWNVPLINIALDGWTPAYTYQRTTDMVNSITSTGAQQIALIPHYTVAHIGDPAVQAIYDSAEQALIDAGVTYIDLRPDIVHASDLFDGTHLNDAGAAKYVAKLTPLLGDIINK